MLLSFINKQKIWRAVWYIIYLLLVLLLQNLVFSRVTILGVRAMFVPAAVAALGMFEGGVWGGVFGLFTGIFCDMSFPENTAMFTGLFPIVGFFSGMATQFLMTRRFVAYLPLMFLALALSAALQMAPPLLAAPAAAGAILRTALFQLLWSIPLALPLYFPCRAIHGGILDQR